MLIQRKWDTLFHVLVVCHSKFLLQSLPHHFKEPKFGTCLYQALFCLVRTLRIYIFFNISEYIGFSCRSCQSSNKAEIFLPSQKYQRINLLYFSLIPGINLEVIYCCIFRSQLIYSQICSMTSNNLNSVILNQLCCLNPVTCIGLFNAHCCSGTAVPNSIMHLLFINDTHLGLFYLTA